MERSPKTQTGGSRGSGGGGASTLVGYQGASDSNDSPKSGFIKGFLDTGKSTSGQQTIGDVAESVRRRSDPYDPLAQRTPARNINNQIAAPGNTAASRSALYGMPNMGGQMRHRRNEMPTADDWYGSAGAY